MKKLLYIALLINLLLVPFQYVKAETFSDADDSFKVISPLPNSKVGGNINIEWNSFDDDQSSIPYYIELLDGATCKTNSYGRINPNSASTSNKSTNNKISWDTHKTISTQSLNDGSYCLQICSAFKNTDAFYSICNGRNITVVNVNKLPTLTSAPTNLTINENESWQYQVKANDADSDTLKYYLVFAPDFIQIDGTTGLIKTKDNTVRIADALNIAEYRVVVGVDDGISGTTTQEFTIRVERGRAANPTTGTGNNNSGGTPTTPQNTAAQITFNNPKENAEFTGVQNFVDWTVYDPDGVKEVTLNFSKDLENWTQIVSKSEDTFSRYSWDVTEIPDGKYYLQLKIKDKKDEVVAKTSKAFFVKNTPENVEENKPLIVNIKPENTKVLTESPASITGDFAAANGQEIDIDSFKFSLNDKDLTNDCVKNAAGFQCTLKDKLAVGDYNIKSEIKDLNGNQGIFESSFSITEKTVIPNANLGTASNSNTIIIVIALILLIVVLIGIPWFFIGYSKRKLKKTTNTQRTINLDEPTNYAYPQAAVSIQQQQPFTPAPAAPKQDQSNNFSDFMSTYSFNDQQPKPIQQINNQTVQTKKIGEVKQPKPAEPKTSLSDTFKNISKKVSEFIPKSPEAPKVAQESKPVQPNSNPNISQNIQTAYSVGTSASNTPEETFVEPKVLDDILPVIQAPVVPQPQIQPQTEYVTPATTDSSDEELKRMYPELYGTGMLEPVNPANASIPTSEQQNTAATTTAINPVQPIPPQSTPTAPASDDYYEPKPKD